MDLLNFSEIKRTINENVEKYPLILEYEKTNDPLPKKVDSCYGFNDELLPMLGSLSKFQKKGWFIYYVIYEKKYHNIEGTKLGVTDQQIQDKFNKLTRNAEVFESFNVEKEFIQHVYTCARNTLVEEKAELDAFENGPLLDQIINTGKTYPSLQREVLRLSKVVKEVSDLQYALLDKIKKRTISGVEYDRKMDELEEVFHMFKSRFESMKNRYKKESEGGVQRRRTRLRQVIDTRDLYQTDPVSFPRLNYTTITRCTFLIEEYCRWHNQRVREQKREAKNTSRRVARVEAKINTPQFKRKQERMEMIQPLIDEGLNPSQIASSTGIPKSTVQRIVKELNKN